MILCIMPLPLFFPKKILELPVQKNNKDKKCIASGMYNNISIIIRQSCFLLISNTKNSITPHVKNSTPLILFSRTSCKAVHLNKLSSPDKKGFGSP